MAKRLPKDQIVKAARSMRGPSRSHGEPHVVSAPSMRRWTPTIDPATIPDAVLHSEAARRRARLRKTYSGGVLWKKHNPKVNNCRCARCMKRRDKESKSLMTVKSDGKLMVGRLPDRLYLKESK